MTINRPFTGRGTRIRRTVSETAERVPRVARLMALAIHFDQLIRDGGVADQADLARLGRVSRARLTQIMNLLNLAPAIQEEVLHLSESVPITERELRPIAAALNWRTQVREWTAMRQST
jgi:hypothetical protein